MAFNKHAKRIFIAIFLILIVGPLFLTATINIDCKGKAFHCVNSTHFKICVDFGGVSKTVDDFLIPCPESTVCTDSNYFECEYQIATTPVSVEEHSDVTNKKTDLTLTPTYAVPDVATSYPFKYENKTELFQNHYEAVSTPSDTNSGMRSTGKADTFTETPSNEVIKNLLSIKTIDIYNTTSNDVSHSEQNNSIVINFEILRKNENYIDSTTENYTHNESEILTDFIESSTTIVSNNESTKEMQDTTSSADFTATQVPFVNTLWTTSTIKSDRKNNNEMSTVNTIDDYVIGTAYIIDTLKGEPNLISTNAPYPDTTMIKIANDMTFTTTVNNTLNVENLANGIDNSSPVFTNQANSSNNSGATDSSPDLLISLTTDSLNTEQVTNNAVDSVSVIKESYTTMETEFFRNSTAFANDIIHNNLHDSPISTFQSMLPTKNIVTISPTNFVENETTTNKISVKQKSKDELELKSTLQFINNLSPRLNQAKTVTEENFSTAQKLTIDKINTIQNNSYKVDKTTSEIPFSVLGNETFVFQKSSSSKVNDSSLSKNFNKLKNLTDSYLTNTEPTFTIQSDVPVTLITPKNTPPTSSNDGSLRNSVEKVTVHEYNYNQNKISGLNSNNLEVTSNFLEYNHTTTTNVNTNLFTTMMDVFEHSNWESSTLSNNDSQHNNYDTSTDESNVIARTEVTELLPTKGRNSVRPDMYSLKNTTENINDLSIAVSANTIFNDTLTEKSTPEMNHPNKLIHHLSVTNQNDSTSKNLTTDTSRNSSIPLIVSESTLGNNEQNGNIIDMGNNEDLISTTLISQLSYSEQDFNTDMYNNSMDYGSTLILGTHLNPESNVTILKANDTESSSIINPYLSETGNEPMVNIGFTSTPSISGTASFSSTEISANDIVQDARQEVGKNSTNDSMTDYFYEKIGLNLDIVYDKNNISIIDDILSTSTMHPNGSNTYLYARNFTIDIDNAYITAAMENNSKNEYIVTEPSKDSKNNNLIKYEDNKQQHKLENHVTAYLFSKLNETLFKKYKDNTPVTTALEYTTAINTNSLDYAENKNFDIHSTYNDTHSELSTSTESLKIESSTNFEHITKDVPFDIRGEVMDLFIGDNLPNRNLSNVLHKETITVLNKNYSNINNNLVPLDSKIITYVQLNEKNNSVHTNSNKEDTTTIVEMRNNTNSNLDLDASSDVPKNILDLSIPNDNNRNSSIDESDNLIHKTVNVVLVDEFRNMNNDTAKTLKGTEIKNLYNKVVSKPYIKNEMEKIYLNESNIVFGKETNNEKLYLNTLSNTSLPNHVPLIFISVPSTEAKTTSNDLTLSSNFDENKYIHDPIIYQPPKLQYDKTKFTTMNNTNSLDNDNYMKINKTSSLKEKSNLEVLDEELGMLKVSEVGETHSAYNANFTRTTVPSITTQSMIINEAKTFEQPLHSILIKRQGEGIKKLENLNSKASTITVSNLNNNANYKKSNIFNDTSNSAIIKNNYISNKTNIPKDNPMFIKKYSVEMSRDQTNNEQVEAHDLNENNSAGHNMIKVSNLSLPFNCKNHKNGKYSDKHDCSKFYICIGRNEPIVGTCPNNTVFSDIKKHCTKNLSYCVRNNQFLCKTVGRYIDVFSNKFYYICVKKAEHFIRFKLQCNRGYHLDTTKIRCVLDFLNTSIEDKSYITREGSTIESTSNEDKDLEIKKPNFVCEVEGKFSYPDDCRKYYACTKKSKSEFRRRIKKCDSDEVFNKEKQKCVDEDDSYECSQE